MINYNEGLTEEEINLLIEIREYQTKINSEDLRNGI